MSEIVQEIMSSDYNVSEEEIIAALEFLQLSSESRRKVIEFAKNLNLD